MLKDTFDGLPTPPFGHWVVVIGVIALIAWFVQQVSTGTDTWTAFMKAIAAAAAVMVVLGIAQGYWEGRKVKKAEANATGATVEFEEAAGETLEVLSDRLSKQMEEVNKRFFNIEGRLYDLETRAFNDDDARSESSE